MATDERKPSYNPKGNVRYRYFDSVEFQELPPPRHLQGIVHRFLEVRTLDQLTEDYRFHALPDACSYIIFDQKNIDIAGVTRLKASSEELNLGRSFHFVNIRFLPGVWQHKILPLSYGQVTQAYAGELPLDAANKAMRDMSFAQKQIVLTELVEQLVSRGLLIKNPVTQKIFSAMEDIHSVADMANAAQLSARQLQRVLKATTGFTPHDFLKVLRLQQSLLGEPSLSYADQSHFIHSFKKATGYTPGQYSRKFDV